MAEPENEKYVELVMRSPRMITDLMMMMMMTMRMIMMMMMMMMMSSPWLSLRAKTTWGLSCEVLRMIVMLILSWLTLGAKSTGLVSVTHAQ